MKKLSLKHVILFFVSMLLFASCLGEGRNTESGPAVGVVRFDMKTFQNVLDVDATTSFYSIRFKNINEGACLYVLYEIDWDDPENSSENILAKGYLTVSILDSKELDQFNMNYYGITDTTQMIANEFEIIDPIYNNDFAYIRGMGFFGSILEMPADQKMYWDLSCNMQDDAKIDNDVLTNNKRVYDVFLRSIVERTSSKSPEKIGMLNAYYMEPFMEKIARDEKNLGHTTVRLRINYPSAIKDGQITWSQQTSNEISISSILADK